MPIKPTHNDLHYEAEHTCRLADLPKGGIGLIKHAGRNIYVMRIDSHMEDWGEQVQCVDLQIGSIYGGDWAVYWIAPKGSSFTLTVN